MKVILYIFIHRVWRHNIYHHNIISIGNHMNSSAIWEIIALSHVFEEM